MITRYLSKLNRYIFLPMIGWVTFAQFAHAGTASDVIGTLFGFTSLNDLIAEGAAIVSNIALSLMGLWVTLTGALLNVSITMTIHIKDFVESTQGVYLVWQTIRDISGMFIIFMLLYASFKLILSKGETETGVGNLIKNVVIVGILINFSFFITSLLIDASNIVSLALYDAIVSPVALTTNPQTAKDCGQTSGVINTCVITSQMMDGTSGGLSDIFLNYLKPQSIYSPAGPTDPGAASNAKPLQIIIQGVVGCIIMFTVGLSFLLAALAFIVRLIVLIILLAFSPIWFASWVIPQLEDKAAEFTKQLKAQLIFMPVYLLLLYAALRILSASSVFTNPSGVGFSGTGASLSFIPVNYIVLAINDFFIIFLLNMPLVVAFSMGGVASDWIDTKKFTSKAIWGGVGNAARWSGKSTYQGTVSRAASAVSRSESLRNFAASSQLGEYALKSIKKTASNYDSKLDKQIKSRTEFADSLGVDQGALNSAQTALRGHQQNLASAKASGAPTALIDSQIRIAKRNVQNIENARKLAYHDRTNSKQVDTLFTKVARKDKVAAAKIQIPIIEKQLTQAKETLKDTRDEIKQINGAITNSPGGATPAQTARLAVLQGSEVTQLATVNGHEATLDNLKLVK